MSDGPSKPLWRALFDLVERPVASVANHSVQSDAFMDLLAVVYKLQQQTAGELRRATAPWLELWGMPTRADVHKLANQVAGLEREVRRLTAELEERERES